MSKGRFTRLSAVKTPDELLRQLRRAVRLLNGSVNLDSLAEGVFRWCRERRPAQSSPPPAAANRIYPYPLGAGILPKLATPITNKINKGLSHDNIYSASFVNRLPCCQP